MLRRRLWALLAVSVFAAMLAAQAPAGARPAIRNTSDRAMSTYDRALLAHTTLEPKIRGDRIQHGANVGFRHGRAVYTPAGTAKAAGPTPNVTQNGVCNDALGNPVEAVGSTKTFWVHNFKLGTDIQKVFILATVTDHVYMWVDLTQFGTIVTQQQADTGAARFESIYTTDRTYFGEPARCDQLPYTQPPRMEDIWGQPWYDADDDPHINIVNFDPDVGATVVAGYYSSADEYPTTVNSHSNEGEFFYMNSLLFPPGEDTYTSILAHEFYHMIQFANDANEETWINEGMADVAIEVNGFASLTSSHTSDYAVNLDDQLTNWDSALYDYGNAYSYLSYFLEHYGPPDNPATEFKENYSLADDITKTSDDGLAGLDAVLAVNPFRNQLATYYRNKRADGIFMDRAVANVLNDPSLGVGQYAYYTLSSFKVSPQADVSTYPSSETLDAHVYGGRYYDFHSGADGTFTVDAAGSVPVVPNLEGMPSPTHELWGNRVDESDTWAVREANLAGTTAPHLTFGYWYDIEVDFDYAYLQVSTDGGSTWTNLACCESNNQNPNGNNLGNGMTGISDGTYPDSPLGSPEWQTADVDLSAYTGMVIQVRFLYKTDPAVNRPGFAVDDVALNDGSNVIWDTATFETGLDGFTVGGNSAATFLQIEPSQANKLVLQLVKLGSKVQVTRTFGTPNGDLVTASGALDAPEVIAIFTSLTRITSETYSETYQADASSPPDLTPPTLTIDPDTVQQRQPFTLSWTPASNSGTLAPQKYEVQISGIFESHIDDGADAGLAGWNATTTGTGAIPWQTSSAKPNWSSQPTFWASAANGATDTSAIMTAKDPFTVPTEGKTTLDFFDWYVNESDDSVAVEVSTNGGAAWSPVYQAGRSALAPDAATAFATESLTERTVDLTPYAGQDVLLRFKFTAGPDDRAGSAPFGWYVDDIKVETSDWHTVARSPGNVTEVTETTGKIGTWHVRLAADYTQLYRGPYSNVATVTVNPRF